MLHWDLNQERVGSAAAAAGAHVEALSLRYGHISRLLWPRLKYVPGAKLEGALQPPYHDAMRPDARCGCG